MTMKKDRLAAVAATCLVMFGMSARADAQQRVIEVTGGAGFTIVNLETWSPSFARSGDDWSKTNYHVRATALPFTSGKLSFGGEVGSQDLFWYNYNACERCSSRLPAITAVGSTTVMGVGRLDVGRGKFLDFGGGVAKVAGETRLAASGAFGYGFSINDRISIPIKVRTDVVVGDLIAPAVSAGVAIRLPNH